MRVDFPSISGDKSITNWSFILHYYSAHEKVLTNDEIVKLYNMSEECRKYFNKHTRSGICTEDEVSTNLVSRARSLIGYKPPTDKWGGGVTSSHAVAR